MNEFLWFNFLILLLCALNRMSEGKISRRLQYAMWITLPAYLLFAAAVESKPASRVAEYISPALSIPIAKIEIAVSRTLSSAAALFVERLSTHNIAIDDRLFTATRFLRYGITALLLLASVKSLFERYRSKVTSAYREWGLGDTGYDTSLAGKLSNDTELFSNQIAGILSLLDKANGISVDYYA